MATELEENTVPDGYTIKWRSQITGDTWFSQFPEPVTWDFAKEVLSFGNTPQVRGEIISWSDYLKEKSAANEIN